MKNDKWNTLHNDYIFFSLSKILVKLYVLLLDNADSICFVIICSLPDIEDKEHENNFLYIVFTVILAQNVNRLVHKLCIDL